jgi:hypothetical protein
MVRGTSLDLATSNLGSCVSFEIPIVVWWGRVGDAVTARSPAFSLPSASDEARAIREEMGFFQAVRAALVKFLPDDGKKMDAAVTGLEGR